MDACNREKFRGLIKNIMKKMKKIITIMRNHTQHYNEKKYWKMRSKVISPNSKCPKLLKLLYLYRIKRSDAFNNATLGTHFNYGAVFLEPPKLPHGLYGIIVSHNAVIGRNCTIYHQVTIGEGPNGAPHIGDNCILCAGAKITGGIVIGNNVTVGTNCVVVEDVKDNSLVVLNKPRIIQRNDIERNHDEPHI